MEGRKQEAENHQTRRHRDGETRRIEEGCAVFSASPRLSVSASVLLLAAHLLGAVVFFFLRIAAEITVMIRPTGNGSRNVKAA